MNPPDEIRIASLELRAHVGVPAAERKKAQRLTVSLTMVPVNEFGAMDDDVARSAGDPTMGLTARRHHDASDRWSAGGMERSSGIMGTSGPRGLRRES